MPNISAQSKVILVSVPPSVTGVSAVLYEFPVYRNRARWPVWCGAYLLGSVFTLLWFIALTGTLQSARPVELAASQSLELITPPPAEAPAPPLPVKPPQPPPKPATPQRSEPPPAPQPLVAPTTSESSPLPPVVEEPPPAQVTAPPETEPAPSAQTPVAPAPLKVEPLFRLTRLPDFGNATTLKYPAAEKNRGREGKVVAEFVIDEKGAVRDIKILKSASPLFDQAVVDELSKITFTPPYIGERPVAARFRREFHFKLD